MSSFAVIVSVGAYGAALFALAWWADQSRRAPSGQMASGQTTNGRAPAGSAALFGLSIAVYCTSWTYYGAVGTAQTAGLDYLPIYLGPFLVFTIGRPFLRRLVARGKSIHSTSIADFLSAHYGKSRTLAALVTIIAIVGALPYIALQLKSVAATYGFLTTGEAVERVGLSSVGPVAVILALFAVMFGTRHVDITRHNRGMIAAVAFDSVIKLLGLLGVGLFAWFLVRANPATPIPAPLSLGAVQWDRFAILTLLSMGAIICLPRQFHVTVVECEDHRAIDRAAQVFLVYLVLISAVVVPIVMAAAVTPRLAGTPADLTVLALPSVYGADILALCVFVGGFAAATGMVIVACVALSTMITTDLVAPALLHRRQAGPAMGIPGKKLLNIRRVSIVILMMGATGFAAFAPQGEQLASLGVLSFAAVAHYLPALVGALYWKRANAQAAIVSMAIGFALWAVLLFLPSYFGDEWFGLFPGFGIIEVGGAAPDRLTYGVVMSLGVNALIFVGMSLWHTRPARANAPSKGPAPNQAASPTTISAGDLYTLVRQCLGAREADQKITAFEAERGRTPDPERIAGPRLIAFVNQEISKTVGASSANILLKSAFAGDRLHLDDVATLLGETTGRVQFSQELLQTTLENISHGVSVVDGDLRLVAWNAAYVAMYDYPAAMIVRGRPIEDLIRHNAERGECGPGETERHVARRLAHLRAGNRHSFERTRPNGSVVRIEGIQTTGGAYVTTYTDVSDYKRIEKALTDSERSVRFYTDNIPVMASYIDGNEVIRFANSAYRTNFSVHEDDIDTKTLHDVLSPGDYRQRKPFIVQALNGNRTVFDIEMDIQGTLAVMQVTYVPQFRADTSVRGFFGVYQDVTTRRAVEKELARTNETLEDRVEARTRELIDLNDALDDAREQAETATASKTRFLAAASHDVLQPLNAARLFTTALREKNETDAEVAALASKIDASISSADQLLRALLNISKLDAGGVRAEITAFPLDAVFNEIKNDFSILAQEKSLSLDIVPTSVWVQTDRGLLRSALQNLVANAVRYTDYGRVLIGVRRAGPDVRIVVHDTGRGIPADRQKEIFKEFHRLDRDRDRAGAGLGLSMVERIAALLSMDLHVQSTDGVGSAFSLKMARHTPQNAAVKSIDPASRRGLSGLEAVCIDNDAMVLDAMQTVLRRWGMTARCFSSDHDALKDPVVRAGMPDFLVLDYQLDQGRTGFDALVALEAAWGARPTAIMITASSSGAAEQIADDLNIPILNKPVEPAQLRALFSQLRLQAAE